MREQNDCIDRSILLLAAYGSGSEEALAGLADVRSRLQGLLGDTVRVYLICYGHAAGIPAQYRPEAVLQAAGLSRCNADTEPSEGNAITASGQPLYKRLVVAPVIFTYGRSYDDFLRLLRASLLPVKEIRFLAPLLETGGSRSALAALLCEIWGIPVRGRRAPADTDSGGPEMLLTCPAHHTAELSDAAQYCVIGHGTQEGDNLPYQKLQQCLQQVTGMTGGQIRIGLLHGAPSVKDFDFSQESQTYLYPLFLSAGYHVRRDIFSGEQSVYARLQKAGCNTVCEQRGLLEFEAFRSWLVQRIAADMREFG